MGQKLSEWPAIKRRFSGLQPMVQRAVALVNAMPKDAIAFDVSNPSYQVLTDALAFYNQNDELTGQIQAWDAEMETIVREALNRGNITADEAATIGYGGLGALTVVGAALIWAVVAAVACILAWYGKQRIEAQERAKVQIQTAVLAHERQAIKIKTAAEAWATQYAKDHNVPFPQIPEEAGTNPSDPIGKAVAGAIGFGSLAVVAGGLFVLSKVLGGRRK